jgi:hypothetical protein
MKPPRLTPQQLSRLHIVEPALKEAAMRGDYEAAKKYGLDAQNILRPTGHETRLMQSKAWLFEAAMEAGQLEVAEKGFQGIRGKTAQGTRQHLEATVFTRNLLCAPEKAQRSRAAYGGSTQKSQYPIGITAEEVSPAGGGAV